MPEQPCIHAVPQAADQLHGVCIFCYRDRLGAARAENAALRERVAVLGSSLREVAEKLEIGMDVNPSSSCDIFATLLYMHGLWMGRDLAAAKPAAQEGKEASDG